MSDMTAKPETTATSNRHWWNGFVAGVLVMGWFYGTAQIIVSLVIP